MHYLKRTIPWLVAVVIFYFLFKQVPPKDVWLSIRDANIALFVFYSIVYFIVLALLDARSFQWVFGRFGIVFNYRESIMMRGSSYLLTVINYNLGQGGMSLYLKQRHEVPLFKSLSVIFYFTLIDLGIILALSSITSWQLPPIAGRNMAPIIALCMVVFFVLFLLFTLFLRNPGNALVKRIRAISFIDSLVSRDLFFAFRETSMKTVLLSSLWRIPVLILVLSNFLLWSHAFHHPLSIQFILISCPVIMIMGTIPIAPAGVAAMPLIIELFKNTMPPETVVAGALLWVFSNLLIKVLFGFFCVIKMRKEN